MKSLWFSNPFTVWGPIKIMEATLSLQSEHPGGGANRRPGPTDNLHFPKTCGDFKLRRKMLRPQNPYEFLRFSIVMLKSHMNSYVV